MQPELTEGDRNHLCGRAAGESATVATFIHVVAQARRLKGPTNDLVERRAPHHAAVVVQNHLGKPYAALVLGQSHSNDLLLALDCVEAFVSMGLRWGHEGAASIKKLGNGSSVVASDESCEEHPAILASQFWAGRCESAEQNVRLARQIMTRHVTPRETLRQWTCRTRSLSCAGDLPKTSLGTAFDHRGTGTKTAAHTTSTSNPTIRLAIS